MALKKTRKCIEITPKYGLILWLPQKVSTKSSYPKKYLFSENPQKYWNTKFWTPKNDLSLHMY